MQKSLAFTGIIIAIILLAASSSFGQAPQRIVSLAPSITRQIHDLGLTDRIVGITSHCPRYTRAQEVVGSLTLLNFEKICSLKPDLILASTDTNRKNDIEKLKRLGFNVKVFQGCETFECICTSFLNLGVMLGREREASRVTASVKQEISALRAGLPRRKKLKVFWQMGTSPLVTASDKTFTGELIRLAGCENIFGKLPAKYPRVNIESVHAKNPEVIFIVSGMQGDTPASWSSFKQIGAVREGRVHLMDADIVCQPTPVMFLSAYKAVLSRLYPGKT